MVKTNHPEILSCPKCFIINGCDTEICKKECIDACAGSAINIEKNRAEIITSACSSCSKCAIACPFSAIDKNPLEYYQDENNPKKGYMLCNICKNAYPWIPVIYITDRCRQDRCKLVCIESCPTKALNYFRWTKRSKRIQIDRDLCNGCGICVKCCPENAIVNHPTLSFIHKVEWSDFLEHNTRKRDIGIAIKKIFCRQKPLREVERFFLCGHVVATYNYVRSVLEREGPEWIIDSGCGGNLFRKSISGNLKYGIWGIDGYPEPHGYTPLCFIADAEYLPFQNQTIPAHVSNFVLEHSAHPMKYLREAYRTMKLNGSLIISVPTPYWHLGNMMSIYNNFQYLLKIIRKPTYFLKNPLRHFIMERAHEKDHALDSKKKHLTLLDEIRLWKMEKWEVLWKDSGFLIQDKALTGTSMSVHHLSMLSKFPQPKRFGVHSTYILKKEVRSTYERFQSYDREYIPTSADATLPLNLQAKILPKLQGHILDVGTGDGFKLKTLLDKSNGNKIQSISIVEPSPVLFKKASSLFSERNNVYLYNCAIEDSKFPKEKFDTILLLDVIEHIYDQQNTLSIISKVMNHKGVLICNTPNKRIYHLTQKLAGKKPDSTHVMELNHNKLVSLLKLYFNNVQVYGVLPCMFLFKRFPKLSIINDYLRIHPIMMSFCAFCTNPKEMKT